MTSKIPDADRNPCLTRAVENLVAVLAMQAIDNDTRFGPVFTSKDYMRLADDVGRGWAYIDKMRQEEGRAYADAKPARSPSGAH